MKKAGVAPGELAPKQIAENLDKKIGVYDRLPKPAFEASWMRLHFGYVRDGHRGGAPGPKHSSA